MLSILIALACTKDPSSNDTGSIADDSGTLGETDADEDGYTADVDCDDSDATVNPDATEICDGVDNDCDTLVDDDDDSVDASTGESYYVDGDGDSYGAGDALWACAAPSDSSSTGDDCDDSDASQNPAADEVCNGEDDDCDTDTDEDALDANTYYEDFDGDGFGDATRSDLACDQPSGFVEDDTDCDDSDAETNPDALEYCDGHDDDCDGDIDEDDAVDVVTWYGDKDEDGYGASDRTREACDQPSGFVTDSTDCDDADGDAYPGADEYCDGHDDDCDGDIDEDDAVDMSTWYADGDGDGYGNAARTTEACDQPSGYSATSDDCDDTESAVNPGATETCNGVDDDCDSATSEDDTATFNDGSTESDYTSTVTGTSSTPADVTLSDSGTLTFCDGTFYVNLDVEADVDIVSSSGDETAVILDGAASGSVVDIDADGVTVSISDLTIQNGDGDNTGVAGSLGYDGGGGIACTGSSTLSAENIVVDSNDAGASSTSLGGGIGIYGCDATFDGVTVSNNTGTHAAAIWVDDGTAAFYDSFIESNAADYYGGVFYAYASGSVGSDLYFEDSELDSNSGGYGIPGGFIYTDTVVECVGDDGTTGVGITNSSDSTYGAIYGASSGAEFHATDCDFDNTGNDIYWDGDTYDSLGDDAGVRCDDDGCVSIESYEFGGTTGSGSGYDVWANTFLADTDATLASYEVYASGSGTGCTIDFHLLSSSSASGAWDVEWSSTGSTLDTAGDWHSSGDVDFEVSSGTYYALTWAMNCSTTNYHYDTSATATDAGFGTAYGYAFSSSYSGFGSTYTFSSTSTAYQAPMGMKVHVEGTL